ncbi:unnamed protein product [Peronospora belbahrii]|uniref:Hyaluronan/mRNA-binding protein domain-containing protein n=1 Tax=Peronospora belbahrii TaxID=622444 RepID=A0AAU9LMA2_9STRA|nr:unnamed protein product [Peronospora belbahrii]CAH0519858.1 unnamed protein product [Peronospora belbahrii]
MPASRELTNKKKDHKDRQQRGPVGIGIGGPKKGGAGAHNWGVPTAASVDEEEEVVAVDRNDPNYDSLGEK